MRVIVEEGVRRPVHASAVATTVVGVVPLGGDDPVVPLELLEADEEVLLAALASDGTRTVQSSSSGPFHHHWLCVYHQKGPVRVQVLALTRNIFDVVLPRQVLVEFDIVFEFIATCRSRSVDAPRFSPFDKVT